MPNTKNCLPFTAWERAPQLIYRAGNKGASPSNAAGTVEMGTEGGGNNENIEPATAAVISCMTFYVIRCRDVQSLR